MSRDALTPEQCRAARALLDWKQADIATASGMTQQSIRAFERGRRALKAISRTQLRVAFESAGVEFIAAGSGKGPGVRLRGTDDA